MPVIGYKGFRLVLPEEIVMPITHISPGGKSTLEWGVENNADKELLSFRAYQTSRRRDPVDRVYPNLNSGKAPSGTRIVGVICAWRVYGKKRWKPRTNI